MSQHRQASLALNRIRLEPGPQSHVMSCLEPLWLAVLEQVWKNDGGGSAIQGDIGQRFRKG